MARRKRSDALDGEAGRRSKPGNAAEAAGDAIAAVRDLGVPSHAIGEIDLRKAFMHFEVDPSFATLVREGLEEFSINGRSVRVDDATPRGGAKGGKFEKRGGEKWEKKGKRGKW